MVQGKGARPDRDEDPHGQKKEKEEKKTHTSPDFLAGGRRRKKWLPAGTETEAREKLPVAVPKNPGRKVSNFLTAKQQKEKVLSV